MEPSWWMMAAGGVAVALVAAPMMRPSPRRRALARARATGDVMPLVELVESTLHMPRIDAWDQLLLELWQRYERELAAKLVMEAAQRHEGKIIQHWILQILQIEPEIAAAVFTPDFLATHFKPEVAAQCGRCGCGK